MSTPSRPHDELEALIAADALGGLDEDGRREMLRQMAEHGPDCPDCLRLTVEYEEVAGMIALSVDPAGPATGAEEALLRATREAGVEIPFRVRPSRGRRWIVAAAVAAAVALVAGAIGYALAPEARDEQGQFLAFVSQPGTQVVPFPAAEGQQLAVAFQPGSRQGWVFGTDLPKLEEGRVYELWFSTTDSEGVEPAGTFVPAEGVVLAEVTVGEALDLLAVSIEPTGGSPQPTTDPILVAEV